MRWLWLLLLLLLTGSGSQASPLQLRGSAIWCAPYVNGTTNGDTICGPSTAHALEDSALNFWVYTGAALGPDWVMTCCTGASIQVTLDPASAFTPSGHSTYYAQAGYFLYADPNVGQSFWFCLCSFQNTVQATAPGSVAVGNFINQTSGIAYNSFSEVVSVASSGDTVRIKPQPTGIPAWNFVPASGNYGVIDRPLTINVDSGTKFWMNAEAFSGQGMVVINATNVTWNGGTLAFSSDTALRIDNNATNPTLKNATLHDEGDSCILSGSNEGTITLTNMLVYQCATITNTGQAHNVYLSTTGNAATTDTTCEAITNLTSLNVLNDGHTLKLRPICQSSQQGFVTTSLIGCTTSSCRQNASVDYPCGGNHTVTHSIIELGPGQVPAVDGGSFYIVRYSEETPNSGACPNLTGASNTLVFDADYIIADSPNPAPNAGFLNLVCAQSATVTGSGCGLPTVAGYSCTIRNSVLVSNPATFAITRGACSTDANVGCTLSAGKCTDANNNRWYNNRTTAAANEGWSGTFTDPTSGTVYPCCAWPWEPAHL